MYVTWSGLCHGGCNQYNYMYFETEPKKAAISKLRQSVIRVEY